MKRRIARDVVFKLVYESQIKNIDTKEIYDDYIRREDAITDETELSFVAKCMSGITEYKQEILDTISAHMVGWSLTRIGYIERSILVFAVYELLKSETPKEIIINEAIEICKKYGDDKTPDFVNGVLAKIVNQN